jgi:tripartite-type tricarboxylate transporter receptor subunit TctC
MAAHTGEKNGQRLGGRHGACAALLAGAAALAASAPAYAQAPASNYPTKPIRMIVPYPPGAGTDFTARALGERITEALGQQVVIDSRPGAAATLGHGLVAKAPPDGYTLLLATTGGMVSAPALGLKITYDPVKDFAPIGLATYVPYSLVTFGGLPPNNMREFLAHAKTQPGKLNFGSSGTGTPNHLGGELLMKMTGISMLHVPYKGGGPMLTDLIAGQMHVGFLSLVQVMPHVSTGRLKVMGVGYTRRLKSAPDIATIAETVPGFNNTGWWGLAAPLGTPQPIVQKLNAVINKALATPAFVQYFVSNGLEPAGSTPAAFQELIASELQLWRKVIKDANINVSAM